MGLGEDRDLLEADRFADSVRNIESIPPVEYRGSECGQPVGQLFGSPAKLVERLPAVGQELVERRQVHPQAPESFGDLDVGPRDIVDDPEGTRQRRGERDGGALQLGVDLGEVDAGEVSVAPVEGVRFDRQGEEPGMGFLPRRPQGRRVGERARQAPHSVEAQPFLVPCGWRCHRI